MKRLEDVITQIYTVLNMAKGFSAGFSTETFRDGKMAFDYNGKRYFLKIEEVPNPSENMAKDLHMIKYWN